MKLDPVGLMPGPVELAFRAAGFAAALLALGFSAPAAFAQSGCGINNLECLDTLTAPNGPRDSSECMDSTHHGRVSYDLVNGMLDATSSSLGTRANVAVWANDTYQILGRPPGTPVNFVVEFQVGGTISINQCGGDGNLSAAIINTGMTSSVQYACNASCTCFGTPTMNTVLSLPMTKNAATAFPVGFFLAANGVLSNETLSGQFRFVGLPAGTSVISCQGYVQESPVAVQRVSWGTLKQLYR
jgi:hypothetical protein